MRIVATHRNTDFDALASMVAVTMLYPETKAVLPKQINPNVKAFLSIHKTSFDLLGPDEPDWPAVTRLYVVDVANWERLEPMKGLARDQVEIRLWDHHAAPGDIETENQCREMTGANITLLIRELKQREIKLSPIEATLFLIGLYEDTGHLSFPSTTAEDAYAAGFLMENGADLNIASIFLNPPYEKMQKDILFEMMKGTKKIKIDDMNVVLNKLPLDTHVEMLSMVVHMYRKIVNADAVFAVFVRKNESCTVIGRSDVPRIDVGAIMSRLGGGGHPGAGAAVIRKACADPDEIEKRIVTLIKENPKPTAVVADLMSFPVLSVSPDMKTLDVRVLLEDKGVKGVPVMEDEELMGMITLTDLLKLEKYGQMEKPIKAFMKREVITIEPDAVAGKAARVMAENDIGHLPVEQDGKIIGMVSRSDVLYYFYDMLPE